MTPITNQTASVLIVIDSAATLKATTLLAKNSSGPQQLRC
jgi:hypothetical protein